MSLAKIKDAGHNEAEAIENIKAERWSMEQALAVIDNNGCTDFSYRSVGQTCDVISVLIARLKDRDIKIKELELEIDTQAGACVRSNY